MVSANDIELLKNTIKDYGLQANDYTENTITIENNQKKGIPLEGKENKILKLNINSGITVLWQAELTGNVNNELIVKSGAGILEIKGGSIKNKIINSTYNAIRIDEGDLIISGGVISADIGYGVRNNSTGSVTINGGEIKMEGGNSIAVYNTSTGTVNVNGGTLRGYYAIYNTSTGTVNINGGEISASYKTVFTASSGACGKVIISPPAKITSK